MLSTITPVSERARHHAYGRSSLWFVLGAVLGGATIGGAMAGGAWVTRQLALPAAVRIGVAVAVAGLALAADARLGGLRLPERPRQVDASWVTRFRPWVYAGGFGWQLGTGVATYVMTNGVYTMLVVGAVWLPPLQALALGVVFGACRGATILLGAAVTTPARLRAVHRWLASTDGASLGVTLLAELCFLAACLVRLGTTAAVVGGLFVLSLGVATVVRVHAQRTPVGAP
jgi:MFS family permease